MAWDNNLTMDEVTIYVFMRCITVSVGSGEIATFGLRETISDARSINGSFSWLRR